MPDHSETPSLDDKYTRTQGRVFLTGTQALIRLPMLQQERDQAAGLNTAGFISGYRGSPLGNLDLGLWKAQPHLTAHHITFQPGINEDMAATAVWGSQQVGLFPGAKYAGVFGLWYGKGPGVDRTADVFRLLHVVRVGLVVRTATMGPDLHHLAEATAFQHLMHRVNRRRIPPAIADLQHAVVALHGVHNLAGICRVASCRLFTQYGLACLQGFTRQIGHLVALGVDVDSMHGRIVEDFLLAARLQSQCVTERLQQRTVVPRAHHAGIGKSLNGANTAGGMGMGNAKTGDSHRGVRTNNFTHSTSPIESCYLQCQRMANSLNGRTATFPRISQQLAYSVFDDRLRIPIRIGQRDF